MVKSQLESSKTSRHDHARRLMAQSLVAKSLVAQLTPPSVSNREI